MSFLRLIAATSLLVVGAACNSDGIAGPGDLRRFAEAKAKWDARPFPDYAYVIRTVCFCPPEINRWNLVFVQDGAVTDVQPVEPDPNYPITGSYWQPIDSLFATLHRRMSETNSYLESIIVEYDQRYGYPTSIEYRAKPTIADGGSFIEIRSVTSLGRPDALAGLLRPAEEDH